MSCGPDGWIDFDDAANTACEAARRAGEAAVTFVGYQGVPYELNFRQMQQRNTVYGTVRPVRRTAEGAMFG